MYENDDNPTSFFVWMGVPFAIGFFAGCIILGVLAGLAWLALN